MSRPRMTRITAFVLRGGHACRRPRPRKSASVKVFESSLFALVAMAFVAFAAGCTTASHLRTSNAHSQDLWNQSYVVMGHGISYVND